jgi:hypothetical protein
MSVTVMAMPLRAGAADARVAVVERAAGVRAPCVLAGAGA